VAFRFADVPVADERLTRSRTRPPAASRRMIFRTGVAVATAAAFGVLEVVNSAVARAKYFQDFTDTNAGPCAPGNYASQHTENGIKCGPSLVCTECCWSDDHTPENRTGWHRTGEVQPVRYFHRPDECWAGVFESWRWRFSDGNTYRCSDGYRFTNPTGTVKTICPWAV
jgi:hypothetical protein